MVLSPAVMRLRAALKRVMTGAGRVGWVVPPLVADHLVQAIRASRRDPELLRVMGERARAAAEGRFSRESIIAEYRTLVAELLALSPAPRGVPAQKLPAA